MEKGFVSNTGRGFTLVELIVVILILGVLSATALPRFIDVGAKARAAAVKSAAGTFRASALMIHSKAVLEGLADRSDLELQMEYADGQNITIRYGYFAYDPAFTKAIADLEVILNMKGDWEYTFEYGTGIFSGRAIKSRMSIKGLNDVTSFPPIVLNEINRCYTEYVLPLAVGERPQFNVDVSDCG